MRSRGPCSFALLRLNLSILAGRVRATNGAAFRNNGGRCIIRLFCATSGTGVEGAWE